MKETNQRRYMLIDGISDAIIIFISFLLSFYTKFNILGGTINDNQLAFMPVQSFFTVIYAIIIIAIYYLSGRYHGIRYKRLADDIPAVVIINFAGTMFYIAILYIAHCPDYSRVAIALFFSLSVFLVVLKRIIVILVVRFLLKRGYNKRKVIIIGSGKLARLYADSIQSDEVISVTLIGYISDLKRPGLGEHLGEYVKMSDILMNYDPDEVVIALEPSENVRMPDAITACEHSGLRCSIIPYYNDFLPSHPKIETIGDCKLINIRTIPLDNMWWAFFKRSMDIILSGIALILLSPLLLITAWGVKMSSPGPVFFCQDRIGKDKRPFKMYKFRSMPTNVDHNGWSTAADSRRTPFGSFIRKFSIDELPQLWNVFIGDMSLVGPRPELPNFVFKFSEDIPRYLVRQQVRPGMTGLAQINGLRGDTSISARVEYDIKYIENWTWMLDLKILFKTALGGFINQEVKSTEKNNKI